MSAVTYADRAATVEPLAKALENIARRLRQGAISPDSAVRKLGEISAEIAAAQARRAL